MLVKKSKQQEFDTKKKKKNQVITRAGRSTNEMLGRGEMFHQVDVCFGSTKATIFDVSSASSTVHDESRDDEQHRR